MSAKETLKNDLIKSSPPLSSTVLAETLALIEADDLAGALSKIAQYAQLIQLPAHMTVIVNPAEVAPEDRVVLKTVFGDETDQCREI